MKTKKNLALVLTCLAVLSISNFVSAQPANSLRMTLYVIETTAVPERASDMGNFMQDHLAHQIDLERRGIMFGAGPLYTEGSEGGPPMAGLIIIRAASFEEAKAIADADPMHSNGLRTYTLRRWSLNEGTVSLRVNFSDQSMSFE